MRLSPQSTGYGCALGSLLIGFAYLAAAGAPARFLAINGAAFILGVCVLLVLRRLQPIKTWVSELAMLVMALTLVATGLGGETIYGASRWILIGPLMLQPSFIFLPLMLVSFARESSGPKLVALVVAAAGVALQPDRSMAAAMTFALVVQAMRAPHRNVFIALAAGAAALVITLGRPDELPAVPYVEDVLFTSFDLQPLLGCAVVGGLVLLPIPGVLGFRIVSTAGTACVAFATAWCGLIAAAAIGNYPTPVVGYSGAAVLGYILSVGGLPDRSCVTTAR